LLKGTKMKIKLGSEVRDLVTGLTGIAIGRTEWINGCARIIVQPKVDKDSKLPDGVNVDEPQLEVIGEGEYKRTSETAETGGPIPMATRPEVSRS
jgi:hypothetical protein